MRKRRRLFKTFVRPKEYEYRQDNCSYALGASHNLDPTNNNPLVVCFSGPQDHCVTRGYMAECAPTLNAAAGTSGNNRPFIVKKCFPINSMGIGKDGGNGDRQTIEIGEDEDKTPHGVCFRKRRTIAVLDRCGNNWKNGKGGCGIMVNEEHTPCLATMFQPFVVSTKKKERTKC